MGRGASRIAIALTNQVCIRNSIHSISSEIWITAFRSLTARKHRFFPPSAAMFDQSPPIAAPTNRLLLPLSSSFSLNLHRVLFTPFVSLFILSPNLYLLTKFLPSRAIVFRSMFENYPPSSRFCLSLSLFLLLNFSNPAFPSSFFSSDIEDQRSLYQQASILNQTRALRGYFK